MNGHASSGTRARRRRWKPPPPSFWGAFFWLLYDLTFAEWCVLCLDDADSVIRVVFYGSFFVLFARRIWIKDWPEFGRELDYWLKDE